MNKALHELIHQQRVLNIKRKWESVCHQPLPNGAKQRISNLINDYKTKQGHGCRMITNARGNTEFVCDSFLASNALMTSSVTCNTSKLMDGRVSMRSFFMFKTNINGENIKDHNIVVRGPTCHTVDESLKSDVKQHTIDVLFQTYLELVTKMRIWCTQNNVLKKDYVGALYDNSNSCFILESPYEMNMYDCEQVATNIFSLYHSKLI